MTQEESKGIVIHTPGFYDANSHVIIEQVKGCMYAISKNAYPNPQSTQPQLDVGYSIADKRFMPCERLPWETRLVEKPLPYGSQKELWQRVKAFIKDHCFLADQRLYEVLTAYVFQTWIPEAFDIVPYVFIHGPKNTGKTRLTKVIMFLSFRGILTPNTTEAGLFRVMETLKPTLFIDENSTLTQEVKAALVDILNSGYERGSMVIRCNEKGELLYFDPFGSKVLNGTRSINDTLESRCILVRAIRASTRLVKPRIDTALADTLRAQLMMWRFDYLENHSEPSEHFEPFEQFLGGLKGLDARLQDIFFPLLAVSNDGRDTIIEFAKSLDAERNEEDRTGLDAEITRILVDLAPFIESNTKGEKIALTKSIRDTLNDVRNESEKLKTQTVGYYLKRLGFEARHTDKGNGWLLNEERLETLKETYRIESSSEPPKKPSKGSEGSEDSVQQQLPNGEGSQ